MLRVVSPLVNIIPQLFMCWTVLTLTFESGELEPQYAHVSGNERIPTWPLTNPYRWNVLLDAVIVNSTITVPTTKVVGAPSNKAVVLMDSGSSYTYALLVSPLHPSFSSTTTTAMHQRKFATRFTVVYQVLVMMPQLVIGESLVRLKLIWPCNLGLLFVIVTLRSGAYTFIFSGQVFPIHPLDVNPSMAADPSVCIGSFVPQSFSIGNDL